MKDVQPEAECQHRHDDGYSDQHLNHIEGHCSRSLPPWPSARVGKFAKAAAIISNFMCPSPEEPEAYALMDIESMPAREGSHPFWRQCVLFTFFELGQTG
jgi:hypothetical protein